MLKVLVLVVLVLRGNGDDEWGDAVEESSIRYLHIGVHQHQTGQSLVIYKRGKSYDKNRIKFISFFMTVQVRLPFNHQQSQQQANRQRKDNRY